MDKTSVQACHVYDTRTKTFDNIPHLINDRCCHSATTLGDTIYVICGIKKCKAIGETYLNSIERYEIKSEGDEVRY